MSIRAIAELRVGREVLDAIADDIAKSLPDGRSMSVQEWRDHVARQARSGELFLFGIPVVLMP